MARGGRACGVSPGEVGRAEGCKGRMDTEQGGLGWSAEAAHCGGRVGRAPGARLPHSQLTRGLALQGPNTNGEIPTSNPRNTAHLSRLIPPLPQGLAQQCPKSPFGALLTLHPGLTQKSGQRQLFLFNHPPTTLHSLLGQVCSAITQHPLHRSCSSAGSPPLTEHVLSHSFLLRLPSVDITGLGATAPLLADHLGPRDLPSICAAILNFTFQP